MLPASNKGPSLSFGFPDVCRTPVGRVIVPIPYPNFGAHAMAAKFSVIVKAGMIPALNLGSIIALTTGDEPGVAHWTVKGIGTFDKGNPIVFIEKLPAINLTSMTDGNRGNNLPGLVVAPGTPKVLYTLATAPPRGEAAEAAIAQGDPPGRDPAELLRGPALDGEGALLEGGVGLVRVRVFSLSIVARLHLAVARLASEGLRALVMDLRGCPGGELLACVELARDFLEAGRVIAIVRDADGDTVTHRSQNPRPLRVPLVLVVDRATASAAEVFAGCLAAHGRATVVGERTYGKGTAQVVAGDPRATVAAIELPGGALIEGEGVRPHVASADGLAAALVVARGA